MRVVSLGGDPYSSTPGTLFLTPNRLAASRFGVEQASLAHVAESSVRGRILEPGERILLLTEAVRSTLPDHPDPTGEALRLRFAISSALRAGATSRDLANSVGGAYLSRILEAYLALMDQEKALDHAQIFWKSNPESMPVTVAGYMRLGWDELNFLDRLAASGSRLWLPYAKNPLFEENLRAAEFLEERGWQVEYRPGPDTLSGWTRAQLSATIHRNHEEEVRFVLRRAKHLLKQGVPPERIVLVAREEDAYGPLVRAVAREYGLNVALLYQVPIRETRLGYLFRLLVEAWASDFAFEPTMAFLRHPLSVHVWNFEEVLSNSPRGRDWEEYGFPTYLLKAPPSGRFKDYIALLNRLIAGLNLRKRVQKHPQDSFALSVLKNAIKALEKDKKVSLDEFLRYLNALLSAEATPYWPTKESIALHSPLSLFGAEADHLLVLGAVEGWLPKAVADNPVMGFYERKVIREKTGLPLELAHEAARRELLSVVAVLLAAQKTLHFTAPLYVGQQSQTPSALLEHLGITPELKSEEEFAASPAEWRRHILLREEGYEDEVVQVARKARMVEYARLYRSEVGKYEGKTQKPVRRTLTPSELPEIVECGFRWFGHQVLGAHDYVERRPTWLGRIRHRALELAVMKTRTEPDIRTAALNALEAAWEEAEEEARKEGFRAPWGWRDQRKWALEELKLFIRSEAFLEEGARVESLEVKIQGEWRGLRVAGRLDRVDRLPNGLKVLEYKSAPDAAERAYVQLWVYEELAGRSLEEEVVGAEFLVLKPPGRLDTGKSGRKKVDLTELAFSIKSTLEGDFSPDFRMSSCRYCDLALLCRKGPHFNRKRG